MKKTNLLYTFTGVTLLITASLSIGWAEIKDDLKNDAGKVTSVSAEFTQEKHMKILSRPLVSKGVIHFKAPNSLRWEYRYPLKSVLLMYGGKTKRFITKDKGFIEDKGANLQSVHMVVQEITRWLNGRFDQNPTFAASFLPGRKVVLVPKTKSLSIMIQKIEIFLSDQHAIIKSVIIYESQDSFTKLAFKNVTLNRPLEDSLFRKD